MQFGFNMLLWSAHITPDLFPQIARLKKAGYDGVEIPIFEGDAAHFKTIRSELDNLGLACTSISVTPPEASPISPDASVRAAAVERMKWLLEMSHILGSQVLAGPLHSPLGVFTGDGPTSDEKARAHDVLRQCAELAQSAGVTLAIEYLNRFECYFLTTAADARALVEAVDHPYLRTMYDSFHANIEEKAISEAIAHIAPAMCHVHISENDRGIPGTGHVPWAETFAALKKSGYDGWLTVESFSRALPSLAAATKVWRDLFPNIEEVPARSLQFMREQWARA